MKTFFLKLQILIFLSVTLLAPMGIATNQPENFDIVFDLDWTLIYPTTPELKAAVPENVVESEGKLFRLSDFTVEVIRSLHRLPNIRISYFSGGSAKRNLDVVEAIYREVQACSGCKSHHPYLILNKEHLQVVSTDSSLRFAQRFKKNLSPFFNPTSALLIDDINEFLPEEQKDSLLWLGKTYNDRPRFELAHLEDPKEKDYSAPNFSAWKKERLKVVRALGLILAAREFALKGQGTFRESLQRALRLEAEGQLDAFKKGSEFLRITRRSQKQHLAPDVAPTKGAQSECSNTHSASFDSSHERPQCHS